MLTEEQKEIILSMFPKVFFSTHETDPEKFSVMFPDNYNDEEMKDLETLLNSLGYTYKKSRYKKLAPLGITRYRYCLKNN